MITDSEIKALAEEKYDVFFGDGYWEKQYKAHIVEFTKKCIEAALSGTEVKEVWEAVSEPQKEEINNNNADQYAYLSTMGGQTIALAKKVTLTVIPNHQ